MNISLTPEQEEMVKTVLNNGEYDSPNDVIEKALKLLNDRIIERQQRTKELRAEIQKGIDSGPASPFDMEDFIQESQTRRKLSSQRPG